MSSTPREVIKGLASGAGFLVAALALDMPFWLAGVTGVGVYFGLSFLLPRPKVPVAANAALGLTAEERNQFLAACRQSTADLAQLAGQIPNPQFSGRVKDLAKIAATLISYFEKKPDSILLAYSVPQNLERLAAMLRQYVAICNYQQAGQTAEEALRKVEDITAGAQASFEGMYQQLLRNDVEALDASAHTLAILMGVETEGANQPPGQASTSRSPNQPPVIPTRRSQKENES